jgi:xanthine dehydrogenase accessory factor
LKSIYPEVVRRLDRPEPFTLATIIETDGSTPQVPGAAALFGEAGLILGTLGGGILEGEAQKKALDCLQTGRSLFFRFALRGRDPAGEEPLCGGEASILIDGSPASHRGAIRAMMESLAARRRGFLLTRVTVGGSGEAEIDRSWVEDDASSVQDAAGAAGLSAEAFRQAADERRPAVAWTARGGPGRDAFCFLEPLAPLPRLLIAGAGHIGREVAGLGAGLGFEVTVIDDRADFASRERFPEADRLIVADPGAALSDLPIAEDTYIVIVTRGHRDDAGALRACIRSRAGYIGMIGSRAKVTLTREQFLREGWASAEEFDRVHAPIGLPIGSRTVEEIAVSIAAELVRVRSGSGEPAVPGEK